MKAPGGTLWGHPRGVYLLSFTELWERFSYYGMAALLVLFLTASVQSGGFGWERESALEIYGWFTGLMFTAPLLGGWIANHRAGERRCILAGGLLLIGGNACLAAVAAAGGVASSAGTIDGKRVAAFFLALALIALGTGLLKPTISSIVGRFFEDGDRRRDAAFAVFFAGIYIGSLAGSLAVGYLGERVAWHLGFGAAACGMTLGMVVYLLRQRMYLADLGQAPVRGVDRGYRALAPAERERIKAILWQCIFTVAYAAAFFQKGGLLTLYAREHVDRSLDSWELPVTWFLTVSTATFIAVTPFMTRLWQRLDARGRDPPASTKLAWGLLMLAAGYFVLTWGAPTLGAAPAVKPSWVWLVLTYVCFGIGDTLVWPTQIAMVSRLAPGHLSALFVGGWYVTIGIGSWLSGYIGALGYALGLRTLFMLIVAALLLLGAVLWRLEPRLRRLAHAD